MFGKCENCGADLTINDWPLGYTVAGRLCEACKVKAFRIVGTPEKRNHKRLTPKR